jgi:hypothetical protein
MKSFSRSLPPPPVPRNKMDALETMKIKQKDKEYLSTILQRSRCFYIIENVITSSQATFVISCVKVLAGGLYLAQ